MEDETSRKESTLILGRPFLMMARIKIDVHDGILSMEFGDTLVQFNIFEAMKHPTEDHSLFGIDLIDELVEEYLQLDSSSEDIVNFVGSTDQINYLGSFTEKADYEELRDLPNSEDNHNDIYAYLDKEQQLPVIIANNIHQEQHKRAIGWKLSDLPSINPSICMHRILMEEEIKPIKQQQRRLNLTFLDVVKKEVTKLLDARIIYLNSDSQWVSLVQVVPKKSEMIVTKNQHDELVPTRIQNSWRVCIDYKRLNQATRKNHFLLPFIDQSLKS
ncbi:hypothetical protein CR513_22897, partial [Mucuna pruriens]